MRSYLHVSLGFLPKPCRVFCFLSCPSAYESKQSSRPMVQLDQHSSPSKYTKPTVEHSALARVETQHSTHVFYFRPMPVDIYVYVLNCYSDFCSVFQGFLLREAGPAGRSGLLRQWPLEDNRGTAGVLHQPVQEPAAWPGGPHPG